MDKNKANHLTTDLINAVGAIFAAEVARDTAATPILEHVMSLLPELRLAPEPPEATQLPVCRLFSHALDLGEAGPAAAVVKALRELEPTLCWAQSNRHSVENRGTYFMENYGFSSLGITGSKVLDFGIMLLGPGITYPLTSYEPAGAFLVIGGTPEWKSDDGPWVRVEAGSILHRPANGAEGKRPGTKPMLALYTWLYE